MSELVGSVCLGLADFITDAITFARLRSGEVVVPNEGYKAAYAAVLSVGAVTTALSLLYRLRNAHIMRAHLRELREQGRAESSSVARQQAQQHEWELAQTHRTKVIAALALLSVVTQGSLPLQAAQNARVSRGATMRQDRGLDPTGCCRFANVYHQLLCCLFVGQTSRRDGAHIPGLRLAGTLRVAQR